MFLCHGVARGVRDEFYKISRPDSQWTVHQLMGMNRPSWSPEEREEKIQQYGSSRQNPDYKRNIYGEHGDLTNAVFVLARLMDCVDQDQGSEYNVDVYKHMRINAEMLEDAGDEAAKLALVSQTLDGIPGTHRGWGAGTKAASYGAYFGGMDVGLTNHPSEILIAGQRKDGGIDLLLRVTLERIEEDLQRAIVRELFERYGKLKRFSIDRGGIGFPIYQSLVREHGEEKLWGWTFDEKVPVDFEDRELEGKETQADLVIERRFVEHATDVLRNDFVDRKRIRIPFDRELIGEFQGQTYRIEKTSGDPYGKGRRSYSQGGLHTLDAAKLLVAGITLPQVYEARDREEKVTSVIDQFVGGY